jgi:hypothetical protein
VAVVAFAAVQVFDDDDDGGNAAAPTSGETAARPTTTSPQLTLTQTVPATTPGGPEPPELGTLVVGDRNLLPALSDSLASYAFQQVQGAGQQVIEVNGTSSFWAGRSRGQRLLVVLNLKGEPFPQLREGQLVDFIGQIQPNEGDYGETDPQSRALLERQGHHAFVSVLDLELK